MRHSIAPKAWGLLAALMIGGPAQAASDTSIVVCIEAPGPTCFNAFAAGFEVSNVEDSNGGGGSATVTTFGVVSIVRATDNLSPELFRYATTGIHFQRVVITVTPKDQQPYKITLREASISRFKPTASAGQQVTQEVVDFRYFEICVASGDYGRCSQVH